MTGTPPGLLPTQTYSYSLTPAASFAPCKLLLCLQSARRKQILYLNYIFNTTHTFSLFFII